MRFITPGYIYQGITIVYFFEVLMILKNDQFKHIIFKLVSRELFIYLDYGHFERKEQIPN